MTIVNGYCTPADVQTRGGIDNDQQPAVEQAIEAASRLIDEYCRRRFWVDESATARVFIARDACVLDVDDIANTSGLVIATDDDSDGTYETTWSASAFQLEPLNGVVGPVEGHAYTQIRALTRRWPTCKVRPKVQITAKWGWAAVPAVVKAVCIDVAARAATSPVGVRSEQIGAYQVVYHRAGSGGESAVWLADDEQAQLDRVRRIW